jgi:uncharacterized protein (TIGR03435 family)
MLIHDAFDVEMHQILGGPSWADTERYLVEAKPPVSSLLGKWVPKNNKTPPNAQMRLMLQNLLADRFKLKVHQEEKRVSVYALVVAKNGPKLNRPKDATVEPFVSAGRTGPENAGARSQTFVGQIRPWTNWR